MVDGLGTDDEIVRYGLLERKMIEIGLEAKIPYEELRDWYCELLLGQIRIGELVQRIEERLTDAESKRSLAGLKASVPSIVSNG